MKTKLFCIAAATAALIGGAAHAADYANIVIEKEVNASADTVWKKVGGFCALKEWLKLPDCNIVSGSGDIGTVRALNGGKINEVMIAKGQYSYAYAFPNPNPTFYHGTLTVIPMGAAKSKINYILFYDQESLGTPEAKAESRATRTKRFTEAVDNMKAMSEAK